MHGIFGALRRMSATAALVLLAGSAAAHSAYPNKTIRFITPFPPGGNTNILARLVADKLGEALGQTVVVENRPGGNTMIGTDAVAKAAPDGYTILVTTNAHAVTPLLVQAPYDAVKSFAPIAMISRGEWVLVVHPSVPANNLRELIALAKSKPDELNFASSGGGGASHLATELLGTMAGIKMRHVPYKGGGPALPDLIAGRVQLTLAVPSAVVQHIATGRLKAIAISGETRLPALPPALAYGYAAHSCPATAACSAPLAGLRSGRRRRRSRLHSPAPMRCAGHGRADEPEGGVRVQRAYLRQGRGV